MAIDTFKLYIFYIIYYIYMNILLWFKIRPAGLLIEKVEWRVLLNSGASSLCELRVFSSVAPKNNRYPGVNNRKKHAVQGFIWTYHDFQDCGSLTPGITGRNLGELFILDDVCDFLKHVQWRAVHMNTSYLQWLQLSYSRDYGTTFWEALRYTFFRNSDL